MNKQTGLAPILIILLIALAVGGYLLYQKQFKPISVSQTPRSIVTPQVSPTASPLKDSRITAYVTLDPNKVLNKEELRDWKTYTKTQNTYTIKYPPEYQVKEPLGNDIYTPISINIGKPSKMPILSLIVMDNNNNWGEKEVLDNMGKGYRGDIYLSRFDIADFKLGSYKGLKLNNTDPPNGFKNYQVILLENKKIYTFDFTYQEEEYGLTEIFLATFKVIDLQQAYEKDNWMSYTFPDGKVSFRYPGSSSWSSNGLPDQGLVNVGCQKGIVSDKCLGNIDMFQVRKVKYTSFEEFEEQANFVVNKTRARIGSFDAIEGVVMDEPSIFGSVLGIFVMHDNQGYLLEYRYPDLKGVTSVKDFPPADPDILSTFKFTD